MSEPSRYCGLCGSPNAAGAIVCVKCGALMAAYQAAPDPIPAAEETKEASGSASTPVDLGPTGARLMSEQPALEDPGAASTELFRPVEIVLTPIEFEPLEFDVARVGPIPTPLNRPTEEPIDAEFRPKPRPVTPPPPKPEASRPIALKVEPKASDVPPIPPALQPIFGQRPPVTKVFLVELGRKPRWILVGALVLVLVTCVVIATGNGVWGALAFCVTTVALLGIVTAMIVWMRRKLRLNR